MKRREFLKVLSTAACGAVLCSCQMGGGGSSSSVLPNAFSFFKLFSTGDALPEGGECIYLPGSVKMNQIQEVYFHAVDYADTGEERMGLYKFALNADVETASLTEGQSLVRMGDILPDTGKQISHVGLADINDQGSVAVNLGMQQEKSRALYLAMSGEDFNHVLGFNTVTPNGAYFAPGLGNFDLHNDNNLLVVAHYHDPHQQLASQGLFTLPGGVSNSAGQLLLSSGDFIPNTTRTISMFGLVDQCQTGNYVAQVHSTPQAATDNTIYRLPEFSGVVGGSVLQNNTAPLLKAGPHSNLSRTSGISTVVDGNVIYGPRLGTNNDLAQVVHHTEDDMGLYWQNEQVISTGALTPQGRVVESFGNALVGPNGLLYVTALCTDGADELLVSDGYQINTILATGTKLFGENGPALNGIALGHTDEQVDAEGKVVFIGEFDDNTLSILVGIPV